MLGPVEGCVQLQQNLEDQTSVVVGQARSHEKRGLAHAASRGSGRLPSPSASSFPEEDPKHRADSQAYDAHMNVVLSSVEETIHHVVVNEDGTAQPPRVSYIRES
jgi:hypothetical protein